MAKIEIIDMKISGRCVVGKGGKPLTGVVEFEEKEAKRLIAKGYAKEVKETPSNTTSGSSDGNSEGSGGDKKEVEEKPAEQKPAEQKPAEQKPAEQKPAEQKPAEEKPAEEKPAEEEVETFETITAPFTEAVVELGVSTLEELNATKASVLETVKGVGPAIAKTMLEKAKAVLEA